MAFLTKSRSLTVLAAGLAVGTAILVTRRNGERPVIGAAPAARRGAPRVLILGAGFGGLTTAIELGRLARTGQALDVTLVDRANYHLFTPMLYQVATGLLEPGNVEYPARAIARDYGFRFREGQIEAIDLGQRQVTVGGEQLGYDRLVIALGSVTNYFGNASIERSAASLKTLGDAVAIRNRVVEAFERADVTRDVRERQALLTFVIVGGGATGVELVGSLHTLIQNGLLPVYPSIDRHEVRVILAEAGPKLLNGIDPWMGEEAVRRLQRKGVEVWLDNPATDVSEAGIAFKDGRFVPSRTVVWAAGVRPSPMTAALDVERGRDGRLVVDEHLRLASHPEVFALGDCAWFPIPEENGRPAPPNAQTAVRQAPVVAANVAASLAGGSLRPFRYSSEGNLVALGQGDGVAAFGERHLAGFPAWLAWRGFYLTQLIGFKNRLGVLVEWTSAYFGHRVTARLDIEPTPAPPPGVSSAPVSG
ncbi:MAG TPA: NAD(P)/FAD-dependent oxidoreductase [Chloroflexota bacterium]|nr:NAD(P)/FAD-dependent oxidoreductase [Chloroflexota bacterium]